MAKSKSQTAKSKSKNSTRKNQAALALNKLGASKGGLARASKLSPHRRQEIARKASEARWSTDPLTKEHAPGDLNSALKAFEAAESNLAKLYAHWRSIQQLVQGREGLDRESQQRYQAHVRALLQIAKVMPSVDGFQIEVRFLEPKTSVRGKSEILELDELFASVEPGENISQLGDSLEDYRFRVETKRRELARQAVEVLCEKIRSSLQLLSSAAKRRRPGDRMPVAKWGSLTIYFKEIDALLGKGIGRPPRWRDMVRHLHFAQKCDYQQIVEMDWPAIQPWLAQALYGEADAMPINATDLGAIVRSQPRGSISTELQLAKLNPNDFERLIFNLIDNTPNFENPRWLTHTNAPDRGRDLSVDRIVHDQLDEVRRLRVIIACKHTASVSTRTIGELKTQMQHWGPPKVDELILATSGNFTIDAVDWIEKHNVGAEALHIKMWARSHLEKLLSKRPELIAEFGLRK